MTRYVVLDTGWTDSTEAAPWSQRGQLLGTFRLQDSAQALALQRASLGDANVIVVDLVQGKQVFPYPKPVVRER